jgi:hypothetical protein
LNLGARGRFVLVGRPAEFRVLASNLTGVEGYWVARTASSRRSHPHGEGDVDRHLRAEALRPSCAYSWLPVRMKAAPE